jgi:hypothetical protein
MWIFVRDTDSKSNFITVKSHFSATHFSIQVSLPNIYSCNNSMCHSDNNSVYLMMKQNEEKINLAQFYDTLPKPRPIIAFVTPNWNIWGTNC